MRLQSEWQGISSEIVTSSDDYACLYGTYGTISPNSTTNSSLGSSIGSANQWDTPDAGLATGDGRDQHPSACTPSDIMSSSSGFPVKHETNNGNLAAKSVLNAAGKKKGSRCRGAKSVYKHVPHREKPPHLVARRNARERRRVQAVNTAFARLRKCVPLENRSKRLSKVKTLQRAIEYINALQDMLDDDDEVNSSGLGLALHHGSGTAPSPSVCAPHSVPGIGSGLGPVSSSTGQQHQLPPSPDLLDPFDDYMDAAEASAVNKENEVAQRWITLENTCIQDNYNSFMPLYDDDYPANHALHA